MKNLKLSLTALIATFSYTIHAQDTTNDSHSVNISIPEVAILDLEASAGTAITLGGTAPTEAGEAVVFGGTDDSIWLNYSSIIGSTETTRDISVAITAGTLPGGMALKVVASDDAGNGDGSMGNPTSEVSLTNSAQQIITGIGSAYTADGVSNGHQLTYTLDVDTASGSYADLNFDESTALTITYTLSDN